MIRVVIADDEELARGYLRAVLQSQGAMVVAEAATGVEAIELCQQLKPNALFTDIRMPDLNGLEVAAALTQLADPPRLVFVTGYAEHAAEAFERAAFDYILKPVSPERVGKTLARLKPFVDEPLTSDSVAVPTPILSLIQRLPIRTDYALRLVRIEEIECAVARQKRVYVRTRGEELKTNYTLMQLEQLLPSEKFMRVHASVILQIECLEQINFLGNHTYNARLTTGAIVPIGRSQYPEVQKRLGI